MDLEKGMIDLEKGIINIGNIVLHNNVKLEEFISLYSKDIEQECRGGEGFLNYLIKPIKCKNKYVIVRVYFDQNHLLYMLQLAFSEKCEFPKWSEYSDQKLLNDKRDNDKILLKLIGKPPYEYEWGGIYSMCDRRGGSSHITIIFGNLGLFEKPFS